MTPRSGYSKTATTDEQIDAIHHMVLDDRCLTVLSIAKFIGISSVSVHNKILWIQMLELLWDRISIIFCLI